MSKHRSAALALAACAASLTVAACSAGTPTASSSTASSAASSQNGSASSSGEAIAGRALAVQGKLGSFPVPARAKVGENAAAGTGLVIAFGSIAPSDVSRFYATALPQAGYTVTTNAIIRKGNAYGAYILFTGHGYRGTIDSLAQFPGPTLSGLGATNVTTIIFAPTT